MVELTIKVAYEVGAQVYLITDPDQHIRIVTAVVLRQGGVVYELSYGLMANAHSSCEISNTKNVLNY